MDYKETINLPKTDFPMKASLPRREPEILQRWEEMDLTGAIRRTRSGGPRFILHDGPPYANGNIHIGHALNKILKDFIIKSKSMTGHETVYVPGWDCHGLPIEINVEKRLGKEKQFLDTAAVRRHCREYAASFVEIQREEFKRLGVLGQWHEPYLTMSNTYTAAIVREFARFAESGNLYKQKKPIQWCASCRTALAEAEVEYHDVDSPSIYVQFPAVSGLDTALPALAGQPAAVLIWTTTPWTIPANLAVCVHPDFRYAAVRCDGEVLILAEGLLGAVTAACGIGAHEVLGTCSGRDLEGVICRHPLYGRPSPVICGTHVTLEAGTGCVHTAPGHGQEDYVAGKKYNLDIYAPVDDAGRFTAEVDDLAGRFVFEANDTVCDRLRECGALLARTPLRHSYPHCWRCKKPVIFRATEQWFVSMEAGDLRRRALAAVAGAEWIPHWGRDRITGMVENRPDWCISRQRSWGVPIVAFYCAACGKTLLDGTVIRHVADLFEREGSDIWFTREPAALLPPDTCCPDCGGTGFTAETDILDVWFDSGVSHAAVLEQRPDLGSPCDMYLEGSDQHRGWFQSSLLTSVVTRNRAPYRSVLTHGFVVDGRGEKMAKSRGNVISPEKVIGQYGAEIIRLWVASENYQEDMRISPDILKRLSEAYRKIRNTCRFMLGTLADFDPARHSVSYDDLSEIDQWALCRLDRLVHKTVDAYGRCEFHTVYHSVLNFCISDMSAVYLDILKDRLYCSAPDAPVRRASQSAIYLILKSLLEILAPVLAFTAEEAWDALPGEKPASVHLSTFPACDPQWNNSAVADTWDVLLALREAVLKKLEHARERKDIGNSLEAAVQLSAPPRLHDLLQHYAGQLADIFIVSRVALQAGETQPAGDLKDQVGGTTIAVVTAAGIRCARCWKHVTQSDDELCSRCRDVLQSR